MHACMHACMYVCMYVCIYIHIHIHIYYVSCVPRMFEGPLREPAPRAALGPQRPARDDGIRVAICARCNKAGIVAKWGRVKLWLLLDSTSTCSTSVLLWSIHQLRIRGSEALTQADSSWGGIPRPMGNLTTNQSQRSLACGATVAFARPIGTRRAAPLSMLLYVYMYICMYIMYNYYVYILYTLCIYYVYIMYILCIYYVYIMYISYII